MISRNRHRCPPIRFGELILLRHDRSRRAVCARYAVVHDTLGMIGLVREQRRRPDGSRGWEYLRDGTTQRSCERWGAGYETPEAAAIALCNAIDGWPDERRPTVSKASVIAAREARRRLASNLPPSIALEGGATLSPDVRMPARGWHGRRYALVLAGHGVIGWVSRSSKARSRWGYGAASFFGAGSGYATAEDAAAALIQAHGENEAALAAIGSA